MYCTKCGLEMPNGVSTCPRCHFNQGVNNCNYSQETYYTPPQENGSSQNQNNEPNATAQNPYENQNNFNSQYEPSQYQYSNENYSSVDTNYLQASDKADTAKTLSIIGIVFSVLGTSLFGWILGGVALNMANTAFMMTNDIRMKKAVNLAKWTLIIASIMFVVRLILFICCMVLVFSVSGLSTYDYYDYVDDFDLLIRNIKTII